MSIYCTSYCNHGHRLSDGKPVDHECHILPPKALQAEREGNYELATELIQKAKPLKTHRGVKPPDCACDWCTEDREVLGILDSIAQGARQ